LLNITKVGIRAFQSDVKPCKLLSDSLDILKDGLECVCTDNAGKFLPLRIKVMKNALSHGRCHYGTLRNILKQAEVTVSAFEDSNTRNLMSSLINIVKIAFRALHTNESPYNLFKERLEILQNTFEYICQENAGATWHPVRRQ
jgi:hypothetical protein